MYVKGLYQVLLLIQTVPWSYTVSQIISRTIWSMECLVLSEVEIKKIATRYFVRQKYILLQGTFTKILKKHVGGGTETW